MVYSSQMSKSGNFVFCIVGQSYLDVYKEHTPMEVFVVRPGFGKCSLGH